MVIAAIYKQSADLLENYFATLADTYQIVADIKNNLNYAADSLNVQNSEQTNFIQILEISEELLANEVKKLNAVEVPENFSEDNKKIIECLTNEYHLMNRLKENFSIRNEYEAADNFPKSKELITTLKERSAFLVVEKNDFDEIFELSAVGEKIEKFLNAKKQLRYDKDQKEQAEHEKAEAAERERIERERQQALLEAEKNLNITISQ